MVIEGNDPVYSPVCTLRGEVTYGEDLHKRYWRSYGRAASNLDRFLPKNKPLFYYDAQYVGMTPGGLLCIYQAFSSSDRLTYIANNKPIFGYEMPYLPFGGATKCWIFSMDSVGFTSARIQFNVGTSKVHQMKIESPYQQFDQEVAFIWAVNLIDGFASTNIIPASGSITSGHENCFQTIGLHAPSWTE